MLMLLLYLTTIINKNANITDKDVSILRTKIRFSSSLEEAIATEKFIAEIRNESYAYNLSLIAKQKPHIMESLSRHSNPWHTSENRSEDQSALCFDPCKLTSPSLIEEFTATLTGDQPKGIEEIIMDFDNFLTEKVFLLNAKTEGVIELCKKIKSPNSADEAKEIRGFIAVVEKLIAVYNDKLSSGLHSLSKNSGPWLESEHPSSILKEFTATLTGDQPKGIEEIIMDFDNFLTKKLILQDAKTEGVIELCKKIKSPNSADEAKEIRDFMALVAKARTNHGLQLQLGNWANGLHSLSKNSGPWLESEHPSSILKEFTATLSGDEQRELGEIKEEFNNFLAEKAPMLNFQTGRGVIKLSEESKKLINSIVDSDKGASESVNHSESIERSGSIIAIAFARIRDLWPSRGLQMCQESAKPQYQMQNSTAEPLKAIEIDKELNCVD